jgi:hypothetical protein
MNCKSELQPMSFRAAQTARNPGGGTATAMTDAAAREATRSRLDVTMLVEAERGEGAEGG